MTACRANIVFVDGTVGEKVYFRMEPHGVFFWGEEKDDLVFNTQGRSFAGSPAEPHSAGFVPWHQVDNMKIMNDAYINREDAGNDDEDSLPSGPPVD